MNSGMASLTFSGPQFGSEGDERSFFNWLQSFVVSVKGVHDKIIIEFEVNDDNLRELLAIHYRYGLPMRYLAKFLNDDNNGWFNREGKYWYGPVFGGE
jgi:hypothetical protein